jgi:DNA-binding NarL/FixJ family response regulator
MRIVIVEDHNVIRESLARALTAAGFDVVGEARTTPEALDIVNRSAPDLVLVDIQLADAEDASGLTLAAMVHEQTPEIGILVLSVFSYPSYVDRLLSLREGRIGYVLKDGPGGFDALLDAIQRVAGGETYVDPNLVRQLMRTQRMPEHPINRLTATERTVLELMAQGRSNTKMAQELGVAINTAEHHVSNIFAKLGLGRAVDSEHRGFNARVMAVLQYLSHLGGTKPPPRGT